jgi:hypothetical protein
MGSRPNRPRGGSKKRNVIQISVSRPTEKDRLEEGVRETRTKPLELNPFLNKEDDRERNISIYFK